MTVKELKEKLQSLPGDARVDLSIEVKVNSQSTLLHRHIDDVNYFAKDDTVSFHSKWPIQLFY